METSLTVKKAASAIALDAGWDSALWADANEVKLDYLCLQTTDFIPEVRVKMLYDDQRICGLFQVKDQYVLARSKNDQDMVCLDSCVEFFVTPANAERYFNFEMNCGGTMLLYHIADLSVKNYYPIPGEDLDKIERFHTLPKVIEDEITDPVTWYLGFGIPIEFFQRYSGIDQKLAGQVWEANFTKCGRLSSHRCNLSWQPLVPPDNFHRPEQFGKLIFE